MNGKATTIVRCVPEYQLFRPGAAACMSEYQDQVCLPHSDTLVYRPAVAAEVKEFFRHSARDCAINDRHRIRNLDYVSRVSRQLRAEASEADRWCDATTELVRGRVAIERQVVEAAELLYHPLWGALSKWAPIGAKPLSGLRFLRWPRIVRYQKNWRRLSESLRDLYRVYDEQTADFAVRFRHDLEREWEEQKERDRRRPPSPESTRTFDRDKRDSGGARGHGPSSTYGSDGGGFSGGFGCGGGGH
ncbi:hypothetical protein [Nocardia aurea]|uniref:hypothetical protein n=1 Tax=Nocardia aurea TaxID=2144174 RepID=UPI0033A1B6CC